MLIIAFVLGLIQGITEFLPVSSSGHLVLLEKLFSLEFDLTLINVILHFASLLAVIIYYRKTLLYLICHPFCKMNKFLVIATLPAVCFVLLFHSIIDTYLSKKITLALGFLFSGIFLLSGILISKKSTPKALDYKNVLVMGLAQSLALFPGLSRSGTTLSFGLMCGVERSTALDFSFLMSIPIIIASVLFELFSSKFSLSGIDIVSLTLSFLVAFLSALLCLKLMKKLTKKNNLIYFVPYLVLLSILTLILI